LAPGYVVEDSSTERFNEGRAINLNDGEAVEKFDFKLTKGAVITGKVTDPNGRPLIATSVRLLQVDANGRKSEVRMAVLGLSMNQTNDLGEYRLYGLAAGRYTVAAGVTNTATRAGRNAYQLTYYPNTIEEREATVFELAAGGEAKDIDIRLSGEKSKGHAVVARVVDAQSGQPVSGVQVSFMRARDESNRNASLAVDMGQTDGRGQVRFDNVLPGRYNASLSAFMPSNASADYFSDSVMIEVSGSDVEGVEIPAQRTATIAGVVAMEGVTDPAVLAKLSELELYAFSSPLTPGANFIGGASRSAKAQRDGAFRIGGLAAGRLNISLNTRTAKGFSIARIELNGTPLLKPAEVTAGQQLTGVRVVVNYGTSAIRGQVQYINGTLPKDARVTASARRADVPVGLPSAVSATVDARGQFLLEGLAAGEYEVRVNVFSTTMSITISSGGSGSVDGPPAPPRRYPTVMQKVAVPAAGEVPLVMVYDVTAPLEPPVQRSNQ
jgi:protocatechuate 3,4-dioxygenase beta subunit